MSSNRPSMGRNPIYLEQRKSNYPHGSCSYLGNRFRRHSNLETRRRHGTTSNYEAEKHGFRNMVLLLVGRGLLRLDLLCSFALLSSPKQLCIYARSLTDLKLPIWFQAIKGVSATESGVMNLPLIMAHVTSALLAGGLITVLGYYTPFMLISSVLASIGAGLLTTWKIDTRHAMWIGYQAIFGLGSGLGMNQPLMAAQTVLALDDVSIGTASVIFSQTLGGAIFISAGQNIFTNKLLSSLRQAVPQLDPAIILATGATDLRTTVHPDLIHAVIVTYNGSLIHVFYLATGLACLTILGSLGMQWRSVKEKKDGAEPLELTRVETNGSIREPARQKSKDLSST